jgi:hypothetical protein
VALAFLSGRSCLFAVFLGLHTMILRLLPMLGGFLVIADGVAFGGVTVLFGRLIAKLGCSRVMICAGFGLGFF